jgi:hypothetical protein
MKIAVACQSPLLQKALELFLANYLVPAKKSDLVIRDEYMADDKHSFYIATDERADLQKPFSKSQLILALEKHLDKLSGKSLHVSESTELKKEKNFLELEKKIQMLTQEYQDNILKEVRAFYEAK